VADDGLNIPGARLSPRARWRLALALLLVGGALGGIAIYSPWAVGYVHPNIQQPGYFTIGIYNPLISGLRPLTRANTRVAPLLFVALPTALLLYIALGVLITLALTMRRGLRSRRALLIAEGVWLASLLLPTLQFSAQLATGSLASVAQRNMPPGFLIARIAPSPGLWLAWLGLALGITGLILALRAPVMAARTAPGARGAPAPRGRVELGGVWLATLGIAFWSIGYYTLPWVTAGCAGLYFSLNHFVSGRCAGLDAADVFVNSSLSTHFWSLGFGPDNPLAIARVLVDVGFQYIALGLLAIWAVTQLWLGEASARRYVWTLLWLLCAGVSAGYTAQGAIVTLARSSSLIFGAGGPWVYGPGLGVALAGLALAALGMVGAWLAARMAAAQASSSASLASSSSPSPTARSVGEKM
jgi:hypothetical protein